MQQRPIPWMTRRQFLGETAMGLGMCALATLLAQDNLLATSEKAELASPVFDLKPKPPQQPARAKAMIYLSICEARYDRAGHCKTVCLICAWSYDPARPLNKN